MNKQNYKNGIFVAGGMVLIEPGVSFNVIKRKTKKMGLISPKRNEIKKVLLRFSPKIKVGENKGGYIKTIKKGRGAFEMLMFPKVYSRLVVLPKYNQHI